VNSSVTVSHLLSAAEAGNEHSEDDVENSQENYQAGQIELENNHFA